MHTSEQQEFLDSLSNATNITDVYFHKGKLYVINHYDEEAVAEFLTEGNGWNFEYEVIANESDLAAYG